MHAQCADTAAATVAHVRPHCRRCVNPGTGLYKRALALGLRAELERYTGAIVELEGELIERPDLTLGFIRVELSSVRRLA